MVCCGVAWCGVVWCGVVWCVVCVVWRGVWRVCCEVVEVKAKMEVRHGHWLVETTSQTKRALQVFSKENEQMHGSLWIARTKPMSLLYFLRSVP